MVGDRTLDVTDPKNFRCGFLERPELVIVLQEVTAMAKQRFKVRVTYVVSKTYHLLAEDEDHAVDVAMLRTPRAFRDAEANVTEVSGPTATSA